MRIIELTKETKNNILNDLLKRSPNHYGKYEQSVNEILEEVKLRRDAAVFEYTKRFDKAKIDATNIRVTSREIEEAAIIDGCSNGRMIMTIILPLMKPILIYVMVTSIIGGLQIFDESKLVFTTVPGDATTTMAKYMYDSAFVRFQFGYGAAVAYGIFVIIAFFSVISLMITREKQDDYGATTTRKRGNRAK